jgi:Ca2+-binding EF-hand superfamily protein
LKEIDMRGSRLVMAVLAAAALAAAVPFAGADDGKTAPGRPKERVKGQARREPEAAAPSRDAKFRDWDRDGNGTLSRDEYPGHPGNFRALDTDNDGVLSAEEFHHRAGGGAPPSGGVLSEEFAAKDHDGNGTISRGEWPDAWEFDRRDHNRDGVLTRDEYFTPRTPGARDDEFRRLDTDNDGVIARGEWRGRPSAFDAMDANRNGVITRDEYARGRLIK